MSENTAPTDSDLLGDFVVSNNDRSFELLVRRYASLVFGVCCGVLHDPVDADDAAQAAFLLLARKANSLRDRRTIAGWLHNVAWNIARRARRARELRRRRERDAAASQAPPATDCESIAALHEAIDKLPEKYRLPLILHHLDGWSEQEVAEILGCKLGTVSGRLSRGRAMLKQRLESLERAGDANRDTRDDSKVSSVALAALAALRGLRPGAVSAQAHALANGWTAEVLRRRLQWISIAVFLCIVGVISISLFRTHSRAASDVPAKSNLALTGAMYGIVVDPNKNPVGGVTVRLYRTHDDATANRRPIARVQTSADGSFAFEDVLPQQHYYLLCFIQQPEFMHGEADVNVIADNRTNSGTIVMKTGRY